MRREVILSGALLAGTLVSAQAMAAKTAKLPAPGGPKPNFVVILIDDSGFSDFSCYGGSIPTPNIDALAQKGVRMSQMYNCARSCPTRASLLTGLYPQQAGMGFMTSGPPRKDKAQKLPAYQGYLNNNCVTFAEVLRTAGYFTAISGKWHVGQQAGVTPATRGFDRSLYAGVGGFYYPGERDDLYMDGQKISNFDPRLPKEWYTTDLWTQFGIKFIGQALESRKPFVLYLAYNAPHYPLQAPPDEIAAFKGQFDTGWDVLRRQTWQRQTDMNLLGAKYDLTPRNPKIPAWDDVAEAQKAKSERLKEIYAAVLTHVDKCIGQLVADLKAKGVFDNTVIMLMSDNGGNAEGAIPFGNLDGDNPGGPNSDVKVGQAWAEVSNTPFFLYKHHVHEGGISTPLIVSYPAGIPANLDGSIVRQPGHVVDIMATLVALSGAKYPANFNGNEIIPMQGINLMPVWLGQTAERTQPIFWEHEDNLAIRDGKWKLVKEKGDDRWQLYDMDADRTELHDLSQQQPQVLADMKAKMDMMFKKVGAEHLDFGVPGWFVPVYDYTTWKKK